MVSGKIETVDGEKLGYVRLATFSEGAARRPAARGAKSCGRRARDGLVLDLRGNGGGLLEEAVLSASIFLPEGDTRRLDRLAHPGSRRLQDQGRQPAAACRSSS